MGAKCERPRNVAMLRGIGAVESAIERMDQVTSVAFDQRLRA